MRRVKKRRLPGRTRISAKHQITLPVEALRRGGLRSGDELRVDAVRRGRILLTRADNPVERHAGALTGIYGRGYLRKLRREWR